MIQEEYAEWKKINESRIEVIKGKKNNLTTILQEVDNTYYPIKKIDKDNINIKIYNIKEVSAPVHKNAYIGKLCVYIKDEKILELDICAEKEIDKLGFLDYLKIFVTNNISNMEKAM